MYTALFTTTSTPVVQTPSRRAASSAGCFARDDSFGWQLQFFHSNSESVASTVNGFTSVRAADRGRLAVTLLLNLDRTTCATPWQGDPPKDPVTGEPAGWDVDSCTLTLGDQQWGRQVAVPEEDFGRTDGKRFGPPD